MNQHAHKIIFNKRLGRMDVVSEIVSNQGKGSQTTGYSNGITTTLIKPLVFALMLTLGTAQILPVQAGTIVADPNAPKTEQPTILNTASGATQVNIQTPTAGGVSMNQYKQFDTQNNGTILNNSRTNANTQTAGWIQGNPWLATGTARVIVNQVNSSNPSLLNGNIEVAGNRAEVIIANPAGIQVNGATFLNASRTTLSTGNPILANGNLSGYQVNQGQISVNGQGLNTLGSDYTDILARSVQINAGIWANQLKVTTGINAINASNDAVPPGSSSGTSPQFAIDTSALGGMYAGKITLIGTEQGVGVNNAGQIAASAGHVTVDVNGQLSNSGTINANLDSNGTATTQITSQSLNNSGTISSQGNTQIQTGQATNSGTLAAGRELKLNVSDINNSNGTLNGQRIDLTANSLNNTNGKIQQTGTQALALNSGSLSNANNGLIGYEPLSSGTGTGTGTGSSGSTGSGTGTSTPSTANGGGSSTVVQPAPVALADGAINISGAVNNDGGQITANGGIDLSAKDGLENHATLNLNKLNVTGDRLDNSSGVLTVSQAQIQTNSVNNTAGQFGSTGDIQLTTGSLTNTQGKLTASGAITGLVSGATDNEQGTMASNGALQLNTGTLNNNQGTLSSVQSDATIDSQGIVNNSSGQIVATKGLQLSSTQFDNTSGTVKAQTLNLDTRSNSLNNAKGQISANQTTISTGALNNDAGLLQAAQSLSINTNGQTLTNTNSGASAGILSGGMLNVRSGSLNNSAGYIGSVGQSDIQATQIQNDGQINSQSALSITASGLDNRGGSVQSLGDTQISLGSGVLDNNVGLIRSGAHTRIDAGTLNNQNTQANNQGIEGAQVSLGILTLDNTSGAVRADQALNISSSGTVNNASGLLTSGGNLQLQDANNSKTLAVINTGGTIIAAQNNAIDAKSITGDGKLLSNQDLTVTVVDDLSNTAAIQAARNLSVSSASNINNTGLISAGGTATVHAQNLDNAASGEVSATTTEITTTQNLTNRGLIDGTETRLSATNTVTNIGTGRIYGSHLSIAANMLNNLDETVNGTNTAATIAARNQLDIGAQTINNREHATLFADGQLNIGGSLDSNHVAIGQAAVLNNASATIESTGNMNLSVTQINNTNEHFASEIQVVKQERVGEVQGTIGDSNAWAPAAGVVSPIYTVDSNALANMPNLGGELSAPYTVNAANNVYVAPDQSNYLITPQGGYKDWNLRDFTRTTSESVVTQTDPGKIIVGGDLTLTTGQLLNSNSQVLVGRTLQGDVNNILNPEPLGQRQVADNGTILYSWRDYDKGRDEPGTSSQPYNVGHPPQDINISVSAVKEHTQANSGMTITGSNTHSVSDSATGSQAANAVVSVQALNTTDPTLIKTAAINTNMPNSSLFTVNPQNAGYFIQTDPQFANYRNWLSSDYMLSALNLDPANMHKRLGDGYYEQKLIREQVAQLTGRRFLAGQSNDDEQYKALMQAGVTFAGQYNLRPGVALTAEQMAHLTSDIVWLVEQDVTLPDGSKTTAWVPRVYVAVKPGDIDGSGSLISANRINLNLSGDLNNGGTIAGRTVTQITAQNLNNLGGRITADQLALTAQNDLNNIGGTIDANTSAVIRAGNNVNMVTTTNTAANNYGSETIVNRVAGLYVGNGANALLASSDQPVNTLVIEAGNNVNLNAAQISNAGLGASRIEAVNGDVNLGAVQQGKQERIYRDARNGHVVNETSDVGTQISGIGNVSLAAGRDVNTRAADVSSQDGTLAVKAGRDINITTGTSNRDTVADSYQKQSGVLSSKTTTIHNESQSQNSIASNLTGASVVLDAGHNANIIGSNVVSDNLTQVNAGNDVSILSASNSETTSNFKEVKKSGLMGTGGIGFMIGKKQDSTDTDNTHVTQTGSQVGSLSGKVNIVAGNHYQQTGSSVTSGQSVAGQFVAGDVVNIVAKSVDITAGQNTYVNDTVHQTKQSGLTVAVNVPVLNAVMAVADTAKTVGQSKNDRVNAMAAANTAYTAYKGAEAVSNLAQSGMNSVKDLNVSVSITVGSSQSKQETHTKGTEAVSSSVAGKEVNIIAAGAGTDSNVHIQGSNISGTDATRLIADNNVMLESAQNTSDEHSSNKSSGWNAGVAISYGQNGLAFGVTAGGNVGKGKGEGTSVTQVNSHVGSQTGQTLVQAGGDTTLAGAQVLGKRVELDTNNLIIESRQDTSQYNSKQMDASAQVTVGYGFSVSGSYSQNKTNADYASVNEQSGILAGDGGYNVNVKKHTDLKGGIITSTQAAEDAGRNRFSTGTLSASDIQNHADYSASGFGIGGGFSVGGSGTQDKDSKLQNFGSNGQVSNVNKSIGYGSDSGHDRSVTTSGINTSNISITDAAGQNATGISVEQIKAQVRTDTTTDTVQANSGAIANNFDKDAVQKEIGLQVAVTKQFDTTRQGVKAEINKQIDGLQAELKTAKTLEEKAAIEQKINSWQNAGTLTDMIAGGLSAPTSSALGIAAATAAPAVQYQIGQIFKGNQAQNELDKLMTGMAGTRPEEGSALHVLAHTVLAAAVAAAGGNDALTAGLSAGGAEALAPVVSNWLYGKDTKELTADEKATVSNIVSLGAAGLTASAGGIGADAVAASTLAQTAVENNKGNSSKSQYVRNALAQAVQDASPEEVERIKREYPEVFEAQYYQGVYETAVKTQSAMKYFTDWAKGNCGGLSDSACFTKYRNWQGNNLDLVLTLIPQTKVLELLGVSRKIIKAYEIANTAVNTTGGISGTRIKLPVPEKVTANNGLSYQSNPKHTSYGAGNRPNAGIEPKQSLQLFEKSIPSSKTYGNKEVRFALDERGAVHRFEGTNGLYHWNGSTSDIANPLKGYQIPNEVQKILGVSIK